MNRLQLVAARIEESSFVKNSLIAQAPLIETIAMEIVKAFRAGGKVVLFGNGGSAADAQHIAAEMSGRFLINRDSLPAISLTTNSSALTSIANDFGYDQVFSRLLRGLGKSGDVAIGISTSGESGNVVDAIKVARQMKLTTVALTGKNGGLKEIAEYALCVPSEHTPHIQEAHILVGHIICELVEAELFPEGV